MHGADANKPVPVSSDASGWHRPTSAAEDPYARYGLGHDYARDYAAAVESARFWHQVGVVLDESGASAFGGGVLVAAGGVAIVLSGPVGWGTGAVAALMIAGGTASAGIGAEQILLNATNAATNELQTEMAAGASFARGLSSPGVLVCGTVGAGLDGEEGLSTGMTVGRGVEAIVALVPSRMWMGAGPAARGGGNLVRPLMPADLGLAENAIVEGTFAVRGGKATAYIKYLGQPPGVPQGLGAGLLGARYSLKELARAEGVTFLRIETTPVIEQSGRLVVILRRAGFEVRPNATMWWEGAIQ